MHFLIANLIVSVYGSGQMIGGTPVASIDKYPWITELFIKGKFCVGSLLDKETLLTTASCSLAAVSDFDGVYGYTRVLSFDGDDASVQVLPTSIIVHPKYDNATNANDFAIWKIRNENGELPAGVSVDGGYYALNSSNLTAVGFSTGQVGNIIYDSLFEAEQTVGTCAIANVCTSIPTGQCQGDAGSPLVASINGKSVLVGITASTTTCATGVVEYSKIASVLDFIQSNVANVQVEGAIPTVTVTSISPTATPTSTVSDAADCTNLRNAFIAMGGSTEYAPLATACCAQTGFWKCTNNRITEVNFNEYDLKGSINKLVSELDQLVTVNFYGNQLTQFSSSFNFTKLQKLEGLFVSTNSFTKFPTGIKYLTALRELDFTENYIRSAIPSEISDLPNLEYFSASTNEIKGAIPAFKSSKLTQCYVSGNPKICKNAKSSAVCDFTGLRNC